MKRLLMVALLILACTGPLLAQYPHITLRQMQEMPIDSLRLADTLTNFSANANVPRWTLQTSPYNNDTVTVTALCVVPPKVITYTGGGWTMVLYDTNQVDQWGAVFVRANAPNDTAQLITDGFLAVEAGDIITMTGLVSEFPLLRGTSLTQFQPIAGQPITVIGSGQVPRPVVKTLGDFYTGIFPSGKVQYSTGEPFEGMLVEFHNLTIDNKVNQTRGTFSAVDQEGNEISEYDWSHFFTLGHGGTILTGPDSNWVKKYDAITVGTHIDTLRGIISTASGSEGPRGYRVSPLYPNDMVFGYAAPVVTTHRRNPVVVSPDSIPDVSVRVTRPVLGGAALQAVTLLYSVNGAAYTGVPMVYRASDTTYHATIPKQVAGASVRYFIQAMDSSAHSTILANSATGGFASDTSKGVFFYQVLNRPLTIRDIQYTPYVNGRSPYLGAVATVGGIVTGDTAHVTLSPISNGGTNAWYLQSSSQPWSGLWVTTADTGVQRQMGALRNGDSVLVTGTIQEQFDVTRLGNATSVTMVSHSNPEPAPVVLTTGAFNVGNGSASAEPYEGMLVRFNNVTVTNLNPTFSDPGEYTVDDGSGGAVVRQDGRNIYSNTATDTILGKTILHVGNKIGTLTGIIYYSFNQYKFVPRTTADFQNVVLTGVAAGRPDVLPASYGLAQNYPNPFNPTTTIEYALPRAGEVSIVVYNVLGQQVRTLVAQVQPAGRHSVRFDAASLSSGVYFYRIAAGSFTMVRKMVLVR